MILCRMTPRGSEIVQLFQMLGNKALNIVRRLQNLDLNKLVFDLKQHSACVIIVTFHCQARCLWWK